MSTSKDDLEAQAAHKKKVEEFQKEPYYHEFKNQSVCMTFLLKNTKAGEFFLAEEFYDINFHGQKSKNIVGTLYIKISPTPTIKDPISNIDVYRIEAGKDGYFILQYTFDDFDDTYKEKTHLGPFQDLNTIYKEIAKINGLDKIKGIRNKENSESASTPESAAVPKPVASAAGSVNDEDAKKKLAASAASFVPSFSAASSSEVPITNVEQASAKMTKAFDTKDIAEVNKVIDEVLKQESEASAFIKNLIKLAAKIKDDPFREAVVENLVDSLPTPSASLSLKK